MKSLSYFKKRTAYLNKEYGTNLSPTALYKQYSQTGQLPAVFGGIESAPDPRARSAAGRARVLTVYEGVASTSNNAVFGSLGRANRYVGTLLQAQGGYLAGDRVYINVDGDWYSRGLRETGMQWVAADGVPKGAQKLTARVVRQLITQKAREIKRFRAKNPIDWYQEI